jgi:peptide/nickel transport system substrate-binding protein
MGRRSLGILLSALLAVACDAAMPGGAPGPPRHGGSATFALPAEPPSLDPLALSGGADLGVATAIYDPLIARGAGGELSPWLADSWRSSSDLKTWTLRLHPGVRFQDGAPFDAGAVVFNVQRQADPRSRSASLPDALLIARVAAADDRTVTIELKSPWVDFPDVLAGPIGLMASPAAIQREGADFGRRPVGTGPFVLAQWAAGDHITATRNRAYWRRGTPYLDRVTWRPIPSLTAGFAGLRAGQIDVVQAPAADEVAQARGSSRLTVWAHGGNGATVLTMNTKAPPFDDRGARLAVAYATDRRAIVSRAGRGVYPVATGPFPPGSAWATSAPEPAYDVSRAKAALRAYGRPLGFQLDVGPDPMSVKYGQALQAQWKKVGIDAQVVQAPAPRGTFQVRLSHYGDWSDPDRYLFGAYISRGSAANAGGYVDPAVDAALIAGRATGDLAARRQAYGVVQEAIARDVPAVWLQYDTVYAISSSRVHGLDPAAGPARVWVSA